MRRLVVYLADEPVGDLEQDDSGLLEFRYRTLNVERPMLNDEGNLSVLSNTALIGTNVRLTGCEVVCEATGGEGAPPSI